MTYTLIHYLSSGSNYCMNCHMGDSSSEFEYFVFPSEGEIISKYAELLVTEEFEKDVFGSHEYVILIDGMDTQNYPWEQDDDLFWNIEKAAKEKSKVLIATKKLELEEAAKIKAEKDKEIKRQQIIQEIVRLQKSL